MIVLAGITITRRWPRAFAAALRPIVDESSPRLGRSLFLAGVLLCVCAFLQGMMKQV